MFSVRSRSLSLLALALGATASSDSSCAPGGSETCSSATAAALYQTTRAMTPELGDPALEAEMHKLLSLVGEPTGANKSATNASANASGELLLSKKNTTAASDDAQEDEEGEGEAEAASEESNTAAPGNVTQDEQAELDASLDVAVGPTLNGTAPPEPEDDEDAFGEPQDNVTEAADGEDAGGAEGEAVDDADAVAQEGEASATSASTAAPKEAKTFKVLRAIGIRKEPTEDDSARTGTDVNEGDVVDVTEIVPAPKSGEGHKYLKLADGRGWIFTHSHEDGSVIAQQQEDAAVGPDRNAAVGPEVEVEGEAQGEGEADGESEGEGEGQEDFEGEGEAEDEADVAEDPEMDGDIGVEGAEGPPINGSAVADAGVVEGDDGDDLDTGNATIPDATANKTMGGLEIASAVRHRA